VWIEIGLFASSVVAEDVTPLVGVWIEIKSVELSVSCLLSSLPSWECGLKFIKGHFRMAGTNVTPLVGVWIEIALSRFYLLETASLPSWECGLK